MRLAAQEFKPDRASDAPKLDVVLIHGTGADGTLWEPQIKLLTADGHRCIVPELRGHGLTRDPEEPTSLDVHIADLLETLDEFHINYPVIAIGHSLGAIILVQLAKERPELIAEILAIGLPGKVPPLVTMLFNCFLCTPFEMIRGTIFQRSLPVRHRILVDTERHSLKQIVEHFSKINLVDKEHKLQCPVHLSVGRFDVVAPFFHAREIHRAIPDSTLRIFEFAGHSCMDDQREQFNDWLMEKVRLVSEPADKQDVRTQQLS